MGLAELFVKFPLQFLFPDEMAYGTLHKDTASHEQIIEYNDLPCKREGQ